jgi:acetyl esterase/lipase
MATVRFLVMLIAAAVGVMARRLVRRPRRPTWSLATELAWASMRTALLGSLRPGVTWLRSLPAPRGSDPRVRLEGVDAGGVPAQWCVPAQGETPERVVLYLHGGGYVFGSPATHRDIITRLAVESPARVLAPDYRLAPEHRFPAAHDDCLRAYRWLVDQGVPPEHIVVAGDSAGGGLTMGTLLSLRDAGEAQPAGAVLISPWIDPLASGGSIETNEPYDVFDRAFLVACITEYLEGKAPEDPRVVPLRCDLEGLAPLFIAIGSCEILLDQARALDAKARAEGVACRLALVEEQFHAFQSVAALVPEAARAVSEMSGFVRERIQP